MPKMYPTGKNNPESGSKVVLLSEAKQGQGQTSTSWIKEILYLLFTSRNSDEKT